MGRIWKFGDDVNTDEIIPGRFNITTDPNILAEHCFCEIRPDFPTSVKPGDLLIAGDNFGMGSSREHAPVAIKACGVKAVVARSFARIFYRNAINIGLPIFISEEAVKQVKDGDSLEVDFEKFYLKDTQRGKILPLRPLPEFILKIFKAGGIISLLKIGNLEDLC